MVQDFAVAGGDEIETISAGNGLIEEGLNYRRWTAVEFFDKRLEKPAQYDLIFVKNPFFCTHPIFGPLTQPLTRHELFTNSLKHVPVGDKSIAESPTGVLGGMGESGDM